MLLKTRKDGENKNTQNNNKSLIKLFYTNFLEVNKAYRLPRPIKILSTLYSMKLNSNTFSASLRLNRKKKEDSRNKIKVKVKHRDKIGQITHYGQFNSNRILGA